MIPADAPVSCPDRAPERVLRRVAAAVVIAALGAPGCSGAVSSDDRAPRPQASGIALAAPRATGAGRPGLERRSPTPPKRPRTEAEDPFLPSPDSGVVIEEPGGATPL
ncbi:MAG TPA: hypothetical protein PLI95_27280 [Polyangiaceae bacterium]|nr:hypothetical protein [Polyangiaceae bacterium]